MRDRDVREALRRKVFAEHIRDADTRLIEELGLAHGEIRVDIAVVNGRFHGFEIKSDADTLQRLPAQMAAYNSVFDRVTIVAGRKHVTAVEQQVPQWWGIKLAKAGDRGAVHFEEIRAPRINRGIEPIELVRLLWREEAQHLLESRGVRGVRGRSRTQLHSILASSVPLVELRKAVRDALKTRANWRSDVPCVQYAG
jgi:hypothetical protein